MIKPLKPTVTIEEFLAYDPKKTETHTSSAVANAVAEAFFMVRPISEQNIAQQLHVDGKKLSYALEIITGHGFSALRYYWLEQRMEQIKQKNPKISKTELAHQLGFADSQSLWHFLHSPGFKAKRRVNVRKDADTEEKNRERWEREYKLQQQQRQQMLEAQRQRMRELEAQAQNGDKEAEKELNDFWRQIASR